MNVADQGERTIDLSDAQALRDNTTRLIEQVTSAITATKGRDEARKFLSFVLSTTASHIGRTYGREATDTALGEAILASDRAIEEAGR